MNVAVIWDPTGLGRALAASTGGALVPPVDVLEPGGPDANARASWVGGGVPESNALVVLAEALGPGGRRTALAGLAALERLRSDRRVRGPAVVCSFLPHADLVAHASLLAFVDSHAFVRLPAAAGDIDRALGAASALSAPMWLQVQSHTRPLRRVHHALTHARALRLLRVSGAIPPARADLLHDAQVLERWVQHMALPEVVREDLEQLAVCLRSAHGADSEAQWVRAQEVHRRLLAWLAAQ
ncbi:MAG: hypothetical protein AAFX41_00710 [Bacteroidota bacterium]